MSHVDHVGLTVPDLDAAARFYCDVFGGHELYRLGPFDAAELPRAAGGRHRSAIRIGSENPISQLGQVPYGTCSPSVQNVQGKMTLQFLGNGCFGSIRFGD